MEIMIFLRIKETAKVYKNSKEGQMFSVAVLSKNYKELTSTV